MKKQRNFLKEVRKVNSKDFADFCCNIGRIQRRFLTIGALRCSFC
jgi:hypothetical protein